MANVAALPATPGDFGAFVPDGMCRREATASGPLDGHTFAVKDLIDVKGCRTGGGNPDWLAQQKPASRSAPVVEQALAAGATLIGKTVTDELAFSLEGRNVHHNRLVNPVCPGRLPGGSSSGSAVAVAARLVDFALGTDTGGSVRVPANFLGLFGFRPSHGAISLEGVVRFAPSYDTIGWFARDAETLTRVGEALLSSQNGVPITTLKLADDALKLVDPALAAELKAKAEDLGVTETINVFAGKEAEYFECYRILQGAEIWQSLGDWITTGKPRFADDIAPRFADAAAITPAAVARCAPIRTDIQNRFERHVPQDTAIVMPITPCLPLLESVSGDALGDFYHRALTLTSVAGHCRAPQVTLPLGRWQGCPIGLSILGARGSDRALLELAAKTAARVTEMAPV